MSNTSKTAKIIKRWYYSAAHWHWGDVVVGNVTFLWYLLFSMCYSLHVAVNVCINCSFLHLFKYRWDVTWFGGFNNASKRILDELEAVYLRLSETEVEWVAVIKLRVNNGGGDGTSCFKIKMTDATKLTNVRIGLTRFRQCRDLVRATERVRCSSKTKPRLRAEWVVLREVFCILVSCYLLPMRRNSVLEELRVKRLAAIHEEICSSAFCTWVMV